MRIHSNFFRDGLKIALFVALATTLAGCIGSKSKSQSFYLLTAHTPTAATKLDTSIGVGPVRVAPFLKRPQIVIHGGGGDLNVAEESRWSEPLEQGIQRVLLQNIAALTGADTRNFPWTQNTIPHYAVRIDVIDLDQVNGNATLDVSWVLEDVIGGKLLESRHTTFSTAVAAGEKNHSALTQAYSELFFQLAQQLAEATAIHANK